MFLAACSPVFDVQPTRLELIVRGRTHTSTALAVAWDSIACGRLTCWGQEEQ